MPRKAPADAPLLIVLHGMGGTPDGLFAAWKLLADKHRFVLVAPKSALAGFGKRSDGPAVFEALLSDVRASASFDARRIYLFGYSNGAAHALDIAMLAAERFAAVVSMAGSLLPSEKLETRATRKIPVLLFAAEHDPIEPPAKVLYTFEILRRASFPVQYLELPGIGHDYGSLAPALHARAWDFLQQHRLPQ